MQTIFRTGSFQTGNWDFVGHKNKDDGIVQFVIVSSVTKSSNAAEPRG
jgi:hypothetical protein